MFPAILAGGLLAGGLDGALAIQAFGWKVFYAIASGLLGSKAFPDAGGGGAGIWTLGLALHFLIALGAATVYVASSGWLKLLQKHFLFGGVVCGVGVYLVMNLVVLPSSAVPFPVGPFSVSGLRGGLITHVLAVGLPISISLWYFSRRVSGGGVRSSGGRDPLARE
jgi:hypothetical protein